MEKFEPIEHTADVGIRVYSATLEGLFRNAAEALVSLFTDKLIPQTSKKTIRIEGKTLEDLLVNWLNELISVFFTYKFLASGYNITIQKKDIYLLEAEVSGADFDPYKSKIKAEIKAATYHNLAITKTDGHFKVEIIFDV